MRIKVQERKRALFTLSDTTKCKQFARALITMGWEIIATSETSSILEKALLPVTDIKEFTGIRKKYPFPPTLYPKIEEYLTCSTGPRIDLVYAIPYPLSFGIDVGGRTLLALAAKGGRIPVMSPMDMEVVIKELQTSGVVSENLLQFLIDKVRASIALHFIELIGNKGAFDGFVGKFAYELLNGENPYQSPASLFSLNENDALSLSRFQKISGESPCFTNMADSDCIVHTLCLAAEAFRLYYRKVPYIGIASKHGNVCGMSVSWDNPQDAIVNALFGNPKAIWGGEFIANFVIDKNCAEMLYCSRKREKLLGHSSWMLDVVLTPGFEPGALKLLGKRSMRKLFRNKALLAPSLTSSPWSYRYVRGGFLRQPPNNYVLDFKHVELTGKKLNNEQIDSTIISWAAAWSLSLGGNEVAIAKNRMLLSAGGGPSTVEAVETAVGRGGSALHDLNESIFAANAFFPFTDAPQILAQAGVSSGLVPSGGNQEESVRAYFRKKGISMIYLPYQYRGFSRH